MTHIKGRPALLREPKQITVNVEKSIYEALISQSQQRRLPMSELVRRAIDIWLGEQLEGSTAAGSQTT